MNNGSRVLMAFVAGAAAGILLGVLFAPMSGAEMRENISNTAESISDKVKKKTEEGISYAKNLRSKASNKINEMMNKETSEGTDLS
jgi:gas vesicle protein